MYRRLCLVLMGMGLLASTAWSQAVTNKYASAWLGEVATNFPAWDLNHDRTLSMDELDAAIQNPAIKGAAAAALAALRQAGLSSNAPALTLRNLRKLASNPDLKLGGFYNHALARIQQATNRDLFVSGLPQLGTIHQGRMGNCFCLAPLGAMVYRDPHEVAAWFETQSNGDVLVKMPVGAVTVPPPTDAELAFASGNSHDGIWINLYEKAIGQARNERKPPGKRADLALDAIAKGGTEGPIISYLTGHRSAVIALRSGRGADSAGRLDRLRAEIATAASNRLIMVAATTKPTTPGLTPKHAYALLEYHPETDMITLWNPHGNTFKPKGPPGLAHGYPTTNGIFALSLTDFTNQFARLIVERPERTPFRWPDEWELAAQAGRFDEAATDLAAVMDAEAAQKSRLYQLAALLAQAGRFADYTNRCPALLDQVEKNTNAATVERAVRSCLLLPAALSPADFNRATNLAAGAAGAAGKGAALHWRLMTRGLAEYRAGRYAEALAAEKMAQAALVRAANTDVPACWADTYFISALARRQLGERYRAHGDWRRGLKIVQTRLPKLDGGDLGPGWFDILTVNLLLREAGATVEGR